MFIYTLYRGYPPQRVTHKKKNLFEGRQVPLRVSFKCWWDYSTIKRIRWTIFLHKKGKEWIDRFVKCVLDDVIRKYIRLQ